MIELEVWNPAHPAGPGCAARWGAVEFPPAYTIRCPSSPTSPAAEASWLIRITSRVDWARGCHALTNIANSGISSLPNKNFLMTDLICICRYNYIQCSISVNDTVPQGDNSQGITDLTFEATSFREGLHKARFASSARHMTGNRGRWGLLTHHFRSGSGLFQS